MSTDTGLDNTEWLPTPAAAAYLGCSEHTVRRYAYEGRVQRVMEGRRHYYRRRDLARIVAQHPKGDGGRRDFGGGSTLEPYIWLRTNAGRNTYVVNVVSDGKPTTRTFRYIGEARAYRDLVYGDAVHNGSPAAPVTDTGAPGVVSRIRDWWQRVLSAVMGVRNNDTVEVEG